MRYFLLSVLFSLCAHLPLMAQYTSDSSTPELSEKQDIAKKNPRKPRFDRGIEKFTFVPKGQWFTGVSFSYTEFMGDDYEVLILDDIICEGYTMSVRPTVGYMVADNLGIGVSFAYDRTMLNVGNLDINLGEDLNFDISDYYALKHIYTGTLFMRNYINIGTSRRFGLYNDLKLQLGGGQAKIKSGTGEIVEGYYQDIFEMGVLVSPGISVFINDFIATEVSVGVLGFKYKDIKQVKNQVEEANWRQSSANFKINILSLSLGMMFYL